MIILNINIVRNKLLLIRKKEKRKKKILINYIKRDWELEKKNKVSTVNNV